MRRLLLLSILAAAPALAQDGSAGMLWNGFGYEWQEHPHRLSILSTRFVTDDVDRWTGNLEGHHEFEVQIGNFPPDSADYWSACQVARSAVARFSTHRVGPIVLTSRIGRPAEGKVEVVLEPAALGLAGPPGNLRAEVVLAGFTVRRGVVHGQDSGWHFQGLGLGVGRATFDSDGRLRFEANAFVHPANSPDPFNGFDYLGDWNPDWGDCKYQIWIDCAILVAPRSAMVGREVVVSNRSSAPTTAETFSDDVVVTGASKFPDNHALLGMTGFRFEIDGPNTQQDGRYIRALQAYADRFSYDPDTRKARFRVAHSFSNEGTIAYKWTLESESRHRLIEIRDRDFESRWKSVRGNLDNGTTEETEILFGS